MRRNKTYGRCVGVGSLEKRITKIKEEKASEN